MVNNGENLCFWQDRRQAMSVEMERERTLQNAVGLSLLPPLEHLILQECPP